MAMTNQGHEDLTCPKIGIISATSTLKGTMANMKSEA